MEAELKKTNTPMPRSCFTSVQTDSIWNSVDFKV